MTSDTTDQVVCNTDGCEHVFGNYPTGMEPEGERQPCPECDGLSRKVLKGLVGTVTMHGTVEYGAFPPGPLSKRRRFAWGMTGWDFSKKLHKLVHKESHFDKRTDRRYEHVVDPDTDEVLKHQDHPLTEHQGHGSAKFKPGDPGVKGPDAD
jgi:hypothetical protein